MLKKSGIEKLNELKNFVCEKDYYNFDYFNFELINDFLRSYYENAFDMYDMNDEDDVCCYNETFKTICDIIFKYECNDSNTITFLYNVDHDEYLTINFEHDLYFISQNIDVYDVHYIKNDTSGINEELNHNYEGIILDASGINEEDMLPYKQYFNYDYLKCLLYEE